MNDEAALIERQTAHLAALRAQGKGERTGGFIACLVGLVIMVVAHNRLGGAPWILWTGVAVVALGWALFVASIARRLIWVRRHPFDPKG